MTNITIDGGDNLAPHLSDALANDETLLGLSMYEEAIER
jgi:hypothetical protein